MLLDGMHLPLTTLFLPDGRLNLRKLKDNVARYSKTPASGLVVLTKIGQPSLLSDLETREVLRVVAENAVPEKVLIAGIRRDSVIEALELIAYAAELAFDAALVPLPSILHEDQSAEILCFFRTVADKSSLPIVLDSGVTGNGEVKVEIAVALATHPNVIGIVDAGDDVARVSQLLKGTATVRRDVTVTPVFAAATRRMLAKNDPAAEMFLSVESLTRGGTALSVASPPTGSTIKTRMKTVGFQVLCGRTTGILDALQAGAVGAVPPCAASAPQACYEVLAAWKDGDPALAAEKQERIRTLAQRVEEQLGVAGIKYGCDVNGYFGGRPRLPTLPLTGAERDEVEQLMAPIRN